jgi:cellulose synthase/poly-beta-1,6-N-acetylglucosamine synthase-like glycosyltransferase
VLEEIGGWDPFNVAEDCDLGIRLHRLGYRTAMLDTTTWEEANSKLRNWVRQRSRWVKGYLQTHLVHTRKPLRMLRDIGPLGSISFLLSVGGFSLVNLINPAMWFLALAYFAFAFREILHGGETWQVLTRPLHGISYSMVHQVASAGGFLQVLTAFLLSTAALLFMANFLFIFFNVLGCLKRKLGLGFFLVALISPLYWILISAAGWKGFIQLLRRPHYWEKTDHGLFSEPDAAFEAGDEISES